MDSGTGKNDEAATSFKFQTEVSSLLNLLANSLYSSPEIFLRELISNSADSLSKLKYKSLTDSKLLNADEELAIEITLDEEKKTLTIYDNGLGMTKDELISNLGTIASSGTSQFIKELKEGAKPDLIGKFGVGFYSVYMVTDAVTIETKSRLTGECNQWNSAGQGEFTINKIAEAKFGAKISFEFKESAKELANLWRIKSIITEHSNFVPFNIKVNGEAVNRQLAPWTKNKKEVKEEEYQDLFKYFSKSSEKPLFTYHYSSDSPLQFSSILFVGLEPDASLWRGQLTSRLHLYSNRVFIQDNCPDLLPQWLRFVYGVVDSADLPLNISRQAIQDNPIIAKIQSFLVKKLIAEWQALKTNDKESFQKFMHSFGVFIKEGIYSDYQNKDALVKMFHAETSKQENELVSFQEYLDRMKPDQTEIYYISGKSRGLVESSPYLEYFKKNAIEVFYLLDEIDDFVIGTIGSFEGKQIVKVDQHDLKLKDDKEATEKDPDNLPKEEKIIAYFKDILGERVDEVLSSSRLIDSPVMFVTKKGDPSREMERILKQMNQEFTETKRSFAINLEHEIIKNLIKIQSARPQDKILKETIELLYDNCLLMDKYQEEDTGLFKRLNSMLTQLTSLHQASIK